MFKAVPPAFLRYIAISAGMLLSFPFSVTEAGAQEPSRVVALTFDDLPYAGPIGHGRGALSATEIAALNARVRAILAEAKAPATGFVVEVSAEALGDLRWSVLRPWTLGELSLGNHTYSHTDINLLTPTQIENEIVRGEATTGPLMTASGKPLRFIRFPRNHTGETEAKRDAVGEPALCFESSCSGSSPRL